MKNIFKLSLMGIAILGGCTTNVTSNMPVQAVKAPASMQIRTPDLSKRIVTRRLNDCTVRTNQSANALVVDSQIIAFSRNNSHAEQLFNSADKLTDLQATALTNYLEEANTCRPFATDGLSPKLVSVYQEFFKKIDGVYADLIAKKITIGVANQERQLLIFDARMKRMAIKFQNN